MRNAVTLGRGTGGVTLEDALAAGPVELAVERLAPFSGGDAGVGSPHNRNHHTERVAKRQGR